ncbi:MAG: prepilin-type N-terminal cleavage/methylation domain-containing protein [Nitrospirota bacterium]
MADNEYGVSLVEVLIALTILLLVFTGLLHGALLGIDNNLRNLLRDEAVSVADEYMMRLKNMPFDDLSAGSACQDVPRPVRNTTKIFTVCNDVADLDATPDTRSIAVVVGWDHKNEDTPKDPTGREYQHSITTVRRR